MEILPLHLRPEHAPVIALWAYDEWYNDRSLDYDTVRRAFLARTKDDSLPQSFVAVDGPVPVGMVTLKLDDLWTRKDLNPWLSSLYVVPGRRNEGIGHALVCAVISRAAYLGYDSLYLFLGQSDPDRLERYYSEKGWRAIGAAKDNDGLETMVMMYSLPRPG
ncbi:MAG: GNAT family N-acetyltransferase [Spirochaetes bacterium]|nr:GNAT family N-acetyltransferase [Spirochaetota bacterium]